MHANFFDLAAIFAEIVPNWTLAMILGRLTAVVSGRIPMHSSRIALGPRMMAQNQAGLDQPEPG